jgi:Leucine-rich repeat (LRR) protein
MNSVLCGVAAVLSALAAGIPAGQPERGEPVPEEAEAVAAIRAAGGYVWLDGPGGKANRLQAPDPAQVGRWRVARGAGGKPDRVWAEPARFGDAALAAAGRLPELRTVNIYGCGISDRGLANLVGLRKLSALSLSGDNGITDAGLKAVGQMEGIEYLDLDGTGITGAGLAHLGGLKKLTGLWLSGTTVGDEGMASIAAHTGLRDLCLGQNATARGVAALRGLVGLDTLRVPWGMDEAALASLGDMKKLKHLYGIRVRTDAGLAGVGSLTNLRELDLFRSEVTDAGLAKLAGLRALENLSLRSTKIGDAGLAHLRGLRGLTTLSLRGTRVGDAALRTVAGMQGLVWLDLGYTKVTDAGLAHLLGLRSLASHDLYGTAITDEGLGTVGKIGTLTSLCLSGTPITEAGIPKLSGLRRLEFLSINETRVPRGSPAVASLRATLGGLKDLYENEPPAAPGGEHF